MWVKEIRRTNLYSSMCQSLKATNIQFQFVGRGQQYYCMSRKYGYVKAMPLPEGARRVKKSDRPSVKQAVGKQMV